MNNKMKKNILFLFGALAMFCMTVSCNDDPYEADPDLLVGTWKNGSEYYRYDKSYSTYTLQSGSTVDVNGAAWDTADDVSEDEAQPFVWTLTDDNLLLDHIGYMGSHSPKSYTVTELTASSLSYVDNYGQSFNFTKVR